MEYTRILSLGFPCAILGTGASQLIRADGSPKYAMAATMSGAVLNCILDPIMIFALDMGMTGAALATVTGQLISAILILAYFTRYKTFRLKMQDFLPKKKVLSAFYSLARRQAQINWL